MNNDVFEKYKIDFNEIYPKILESFVKIYGEENRSIIEDKMKDIYINTYITKDHLRAYNNKRLTKKENELTVMFLEQVGEKLSEEEKNKVQKDGSYYLTENLKKVMETSFDSNRFIDGDYAPIYSFGKEIEEDNDWVNQSILKNRCKVLNSLGLEITPDNYDEIIELKDSQKIAEKVNGMYKASINCREQFEKYKESIKEDLEYIENCGKLENKIRDEETIEFYNEISPYLSEEEQKNISDAIKLDNTISLYKFKQIVDKKDIYLNALTSYGIGLVESFSNDSEELMNSSGENKDYEISNIKKNRIKYFKSMGIDLGDEYESYTQDKNVKSLIPNSELVEKIKQIRLEHIEKANNRIWKNTGTYKQNLDELDNLDLLVEDSFNKNFVEGGVICLSPNLVYNENNNMEMKNILHIPVLDMLEEYKDVMFIHEIGHAIETSFYMQDTKKVIFKTGFENLDDEILDKNNNNNTNVNIDEIIEDSSTRKYELFSESIHQKIAMEITDNLHENGIYLFNDPENAKIKGGTSYEHYNIIIDDFYDNFKQEILNSRLNEDLDVLIEKVGEDNFDKSNKTVNEYSKLPYMKLMTDFINKKDTDLTKKATELINNSKQIVNDMQEYSKENNKISEFEKFLKGNVVAEEKIVEKNINKDILTKNYLKNEKDDR